MKWLRITSPFWQLFILLSLAMLLGWDSEPVPGPDGRIVCELYEFPLNHRQESFHSISLVQEMPGKKSANTIHIQHHLVDHAPILYLIPSETPKLLQWLVEAAPFLKEVLPGKHKYRLYGGKVMVVSITLDEWKRLRTAREEDSAHIRCLMIE